MKKITLVTLLYLVITLLPSTVYAQTESNSGIFRARVIKILEEKNIQREDGSKTVQQNLLLRGLEKEWNNKEYTHYGISQIDVANTNKYQLGDKVVVNEVRNTDGTNSYYVVDFVRSGYLLILALIFSLIIIVIGKVKGLKSIISLIVSFWVILKIIIPQIINGRSPLIVGVLGALLILAIIIYLTEGWTRKSHLAIISVFLSLSITFLISWIFTNLTRLTGLAQEESTFLLGANGGTLNFKGLLLTGILIGTVGVLDDVIIGQIETVKQIKQANPNLSRREIYRSAYEVGNAHLGAIVNTLFLTYAGASLPLLLLFHFNPTGTTTFSEIINNELIATEIIRTLVGSIGVALSMPIATILATIGLKNKVN